MNERQRFIETLTFGKPDKVPLDPGHPRESTLAAWRQQGLPVEVHWRAALYEALNLPYDPPVAPPDLSVSFKMIPTFEEKVLEHRDGHYIIQDWMGAITEISDRYDYTYIRSAKDFVTRKWHRFPVQERHDWKEMQRRFDPSHPKRFPSNFESRARLLREREQVLSLSVNGPFWQLREWCGFEGLCFLMTEDPSLVQEMVDFWEAFVLQTLQPILEHGILDYVIVNEDMAYKLHSMISPKMARRFLLPCWQHWVKALLQTGCPVICIDSDGYMAELMPLWIEAGFNCCYPVEVAAGNDIAALRQRYGKQMAFIGGIDKRALATGGKVMHTELMRVIPPLLELGGYIPSCDHGVPPDISWPKFIEYTRLLAQLTGWLS